MDAKTKAIVAHITLIGWIVALVMNSGENKDELTSFYIRQMLGLILFSFISLVPILGWLLWIGVLILWVISLIGAISGEEREVPLVGHLFQEWFKSL